MIVADIVFASIVAAIFVAAFIVPICWRVARLLATVVSTIIPRTLLVGQTLAGLGTVMRFAIEQPLLFIPASVLQALFPDAS